MHENGLGYLNHVMVAGLVGHALAEAMFVEARDGMVEKDRQERGRRARARVAQILRALAATLAPSIDSHEPATAS